jgi:hypothetical protein
MGVLVNPIVTYDATGFHSSDMPEFGMCHGESIRLEDVIRDSTIILSMPEYSASAPLVAFEKKYENLRVASMPQVARSMEETGLSADYKEIAAICTRLGRLFDRSEGIKVAFSTGHTCYKVGMTVTARVCPPSPTGRAQEAHERDVGARFSTQSNESCDWKSTTICGILVSRPKHHHSSQCSRR